jgi:hypothetical protein
MRQTVHWSGDEALSQRQDDHRTGLGISLTTKLLKPAIYRFPPCARVDLMMEKTSSIISADSFLVIPVPACSFSTISAFVMSVLPRRYG